MSAREDAVAEARSWIRTPFHHGARIKGVGVDCGQLLAAVYQPGLEGPDYLAGWWQHSDQELLLDLVLAYTHEVDVPQLGDVAIWKFGRTWSHAGIVTDWPTVIHAMGGLAVTEEDTVANRLFEGRQVRFFSPWGER